MEENSAEGYQIQREALGSSGATHASRLGEDTSEVRLVALLGSSEDIQMSSCPTDGLSSPFLSLQVQHNELAFWALAV